MTKGSPAVFGLYRRGDSRRVIVIGIRGSIAKPLFEGIHERFDDGDHLTVKAGTGGFPPLIA